MPKSFDNGGQKEKPVKEYPARDSGRLNSPPPAEPRDVPSRSA